MEKLAEIKVHDVADFVGLAADAQDLGDFFATLKLDEITFCP